MNLQIINLINLVVRKILMDKKILNFEIVLTVPLKDGIFLNLNNFGNIILEVDHKQNKFSTSYFRLSKGYICPVGLTPLRDRAP